MLRYSETSAEQVLALHTLEKSINVVQKVTLRQAFAVFTALEEEGYEIRKMDRYQTSEHKTSEYPDSVEQEPASAGSKIDAE